MNITKRIVSAAVFFKAFLAQVPAFCQAVGTEKALFSTELSTAKKLIEIVIEFFVTYSFQVLGGIIVLILGLFAANLVARFLTNFCGKKNIDVTVTKFLVQIVKILVIVFAAIIALGNFGITIAPIIAGLSVVGFGTSFALQGPLSNYAAGITLVFTKPFKVGDIIEVAGVTGEVCDMTLARTEIITVDGTMVVVPNKHIIGEVIQNYSEYKRLDIKVGISYSSDVGKAIDVVKDVVKREERVVREKPSKIGLLEFADSSINIYARLWCKQKDYWDTMFSVNKAINEAFSENGITIPFPQVDVHLDK